VRQLTTITGVRIVTHLQGDDRERLRLEVLRRFPRAHVYIGTPFNTPPGATVSGTNERDMDAALSMLREMAGLSYSK